MISEQSIKHLEFIQAIITRMNTNSFQIKGWSITIVAALLAVFASTKNELFILVSILPVIVFWFLDSYYLMQERKFRALYNDVAGITENPKDIKTFGMRPDLYVGGKYSYLDVWKSPMIFRLYMPLFLLLAGTYLYLIKCL